jgi:hypothetical protein
LVAFVDGVYERLATNNLQMLTGKRFRITSPCLAVDQSGVQRTSVTLPRGAVIDVIDGPKPDNPLLRVVWDRKWLLMFEQDLRERGEEILDAAAAEST